MASKSQKPHKTQCFRASENPENSRRSAQNANKTSILHVEFAVAIVTKKPSKICQNCLKTQKIDPKTASSRPFRKFHAFQNDV